MLLAAPITELTVESGTLALLEEFLAGYFDGAEHELGHDPVAPLFPRAELRFQQSGLPQPLDGLGITAVWAEPSQLEREWELVEGVVQEMVYARVHLDFLVRASGAQSSSASPDYHGMRCASLLQALLNNAAAVHPLAQKGLHRLRCGLPQLVSAGRYSSAPDLAYSLRRVSCRGRLRVPVLSQPRAVLPTAPGSLVAATAGPEQIDLTWVDLAANETGFILERCVGVMCSGFVLLDTLPADTESYADTSVVRGETYRYRLRAFNGDGESANSNVAEASTPPLPAPTDLSATAGLGPQVELAWTDAADDEEGFTVERCHGTDCQGFTELVELGADATTYVDGTVADGETYRYRVRAFKDPVVSAWSNVADVTVPLALTWEMTGDSVALSWNAASETPALVEIERRAGVGAWAVIGQAASGTAYVDEDVLAAWPAGVGLSYRVRPFTAGFGPYSNEAVLPVRDWLADLLLGADPLGHDAVLAWTVAGAQAVDAVTVEKQLSEEEGWLFVASLAGSALDYTDVAALDGLAAGETVAYRVRGFTAGYLPSPSNAAACLPNQGEFNLLAWYNAQDVANGSVATLPDRRWLGKDLTQADSGLRPVAAESGGPNGRRALQFSGTGTGLDATKQWLGHAAFYDAEHENFPERLTVMVIMRRTGLLPGAGDSTLEKYLLRLLGDFVVVSAGMVSSGRALLYQARASTAPEDNLLTWASWPPSEFDRGVVPHGLYDTDWHVIVAAESVNPGLAPTLYVDGVEVGHERFTMAKKILDLRLGAGPNAGDGFWGEIADVAIWRDLTPVAAIQRYAEIEYGVGG